MKDCFNEFAIEQLGYYVYALVDPRDNEVFYIGKGKGTRVFDHARAALKDDDEQSLKLDFIREILKDGTTKVKCYILRHGLKTDEVALEIESTLIDLLTYKKIKTTKFLLNRNQGLHQDLLGIKDIEEINSYYTGEKLKPQGDDHLLLVSLNKSYNKKHGEQGSSWREDEYRATRRCWHLSKIKAQRVDYVLGVYKNIVRTVIEVTGIDDPVKEDDGFSFDPERISFSGKLLNDSPYLYKDTSDYKFGSGGSVRYVPTDPKEWKKRK